VNSGDFIVVHTLVGTVYLPSGRVTLCNKTKIKSISMIQYEDMEECAIRQQMFHLPVNVNWGINPEQKMW
jgi:hypothetical protein